MDNSGIIPTMDYSRANNYNDGMFGGEWAWILVILFAFGGFGFGGNRMNGLETDIDTRFLERDVFNTNQNVSNTACQTQRDVLESRYTTQLGLQQLGSQAQECCCETQKEILQNRYDNALQTQTLSSQMAQCCCDLKTAIHAEGEATRSMIQADKIEQLRDQVFATNTALNNANLANQIINSIIPRPAPAYPSCSPFVPSYYGFGNNGCGCGCGNATVI